MNAVDTNVFLYAVDRNDPAKQLKAQSLLLQLSQGPIQTYLLWQVLGEFVQQLRRWKDQGRVQQTEFLQYVQSLRNLFPLALPTVDVIDRALDMSDRFSLSHWDSMVLGACQAIGVTTLYTEDIGAPRVIDGIRLANPF